MPAFFGANIMFRRRVFDAGRRFNTQLGRIGNRARLGEEAQLQNALRGDGRIGRYLPKAAVWRSARVDRQDGRRWVKGQMKNGSVMAQRIEDVFAGRLPLKS